MLPGNVHVKYACGVLAILIAAGVPGFAQKARHSAVQVMASRDKVHKPVDENSNRGKPGKPSVSLVILGTLQDGGAPHAGCRKHCCKRLFLHPDKAFKVVSLGLADRANNQTWLFEATPDFAQQAKTLRNLAAPDHKEAPDGIFLTHAHIGHYSGLMYLGKEAMNTSEVRVFAMPRMKTFLAQTGPWSQLVSNKNISLAELQDDGDISLSANVRVRPFAVPHRDEYSETVGYIITGPSRKALFIPDIDKWEKWKTDIRAAIAGVDYAFVDGTFYDGAEIANRDISTIPHPFIIESMTLFADLEPAEKKKIYFIHFNHTNPVIHEGSVQHRQVIQNGFNVAKIGKQFKL